MSMKTKRYSFLILFCSALTLLFFQSFSVRFLPDANIASAQTTRTFNTPTTVDSSAYALHPHAAIDDNSYIYVTYEDYKDSADCIYFMKSTNNGASFGSGAKVESASRWYPRIARNNAQDAYVIHTVLTSSTYYALGFKSTHPGGPYAFSKKLDAADKGIDGASVVIQQDIAVENVSGIDNVCVVTGDNKEGGPGNFHIYSFSSSNEGTSWTGPTAVSDNPHARYPAIAVKKSGESHVYVAWVYIGNSIQFDYSTDGGVTWQADTTVSGTGTVQEQRPGLAASKVGSDWVFCVWCAASSGIKNVYFDYSRDGGVTWHYTADDKRIASDGYAGYDQDQASIAVQPGTTHLYAAWRDTRDNHIYFQEATYVDETTGFRWGIDTNGNGIVESGEAGADLRVSDTASGSEEDPTVVASSTGEVYVVWRDTGSSIKCARYGAAPVGSGAPSAPSSLSAAAGDGVITLDWADNTEADFSYYNIYRAITRGAWGAAATATSSVSQYTDTSVTNGTCYWYVVTAVDTGGNESGYSSDTHATPNADDTTAPSAPTGLSAAAGNGEVSLSWTAPGDADLSSYHVYRSIVSGNYYYYVDSVAAPITFYLNTGLTNGITYYYVVTAIDTSNNESSDSNEASAAPTAGYGSGTGTAPGSAPGAGEGFGPGGGCFIATACYGSALSEEVRVLSIFRDRCLLGNSLGRAFVSGYYRVSPPVAEFISEKPLVRFLVRIQLRPWIKVADFLMRG